MKKWKNLITLMTVLISVNIASAGLFYYCEDEGGIDFNCNSSCGGSCTIYIISGPCGACAHTWNPFSWCSSGKPFYVTYTKTPGNCYSTVIEGTCGCVASGPASPPGMMACTCTP